MNPNCYLIMNERVRKLWANALRSGNYRQGKQALKVKTKDGECVLCALGVLCHLFLEDTGEGDWELQKQGNFAFLGREFQIPVCVMDWAGLDIPDPYLTPAVRVTEANDKLNWTFTQIADLIDPPAKVAA